MRIDVHAHYWTEDYIDLLADLGQADAGAARGIGAGAGAELEARLRLMDRAAWREEENRSAPASQQVSASAVTGPNPIQPRRQHLRPGEVPCGIQQPVTQHVQAGLQRGQHVQRGVHLQLPGR